MRERAVLEQKDEKAWEGNHAIPDHAAGYHNSHHFY
jgi:hypothetical protein